MERMILRHPEACDEMENLLWSRECTHGTWGQGMPKCPDKIWVISNILNISNILSERSFYISNKHGNTISTNKTKQREKEEWRVDDQQTKKGKKKQRKKKKRKKDKKKLFW